MNGHGEKKSRKAEQFIAALLSYPSIEAAAKSIGIKDLASCLHSEANTNTTLRVSNATNA